MSQQVPDYQNTFHHYSQENYNDPNLSCLRYLFEQYHLTNANPVALYHREHDSVCIVRLSPNTEISLNGVGRVTSPSVKSGILTVWQK